MKVELAKSAGFCFGVERAVQTVYDQVKEGHPPIYTYGPIIHNEEVVREFRELGVRVISSDEEISQIQEGTIIIRSHGISKAVQEMLEYRKTTLASQGKQLSIVNATCPFVLRIHRYVMEYSAKGDWIVIVGNPTHPEVQGIYGWSNQDRTTIVESIEDALDFNVQLENHLCIVAQTTFNLNKFQDIVEIITKKGYNSNVLSTICSATEVRQKEAADLSARVDAMVVIGDKNSSNSKKLYEICRENCLNTYFIQTKSDLKDTSLTRFDYVGITAGASTPKNIIEEVQKYVRNEL